MGHEDAYRCKLEILDEEAAGVADTVRRIAVMSADRSKRPAGMSDELLIDDIAQARSALAEIRSRFATVLGAGVLEEAEVERLAGRSCDAETRRLFEALEEADTKVWTGRIEAAKAHLRAMRAAAEDEAASIADTMAREAVARVATVLAPPFPSMPGSAPTSNMSLAALRLVLEQELASSADDVPLAVLSADQRRVGLTAVQVALQIECRRLEEKSFENEEPPLAATTCLVAPTSSSSPVSANREGSPTTGGRNLLDSSPKPKEAVKRLPNLCPNDRPSKVLSQALIAQFDRQVQSVNSIEGYNGYAKHTQKLLAALQLGEACEFVVVPGGRYALGQDDVSCLSTLLPVAGSVDHEARLDRRTMHWLLSPASRKLDGTRFVDGPLHYFYSTRRRDIDLPAFYVSKIPFTITKFKQLLSDRRYSSRLAGLVPDTLLLSRSQRLQFAPTYMAKTGELDGYTASTPARRSSLTGENTTSDDDDDSLEVPYFAAEAIAAALGGVVCPIDVWEAAGMGADGRQSHLVTADECSSLDVHELRWRVMVDNGTRQVAGSSWRIGPKGKRLLRRKKTLFGLESFNRQGCEWNSVADVCGGDHCAIPRGTELVPTTHVLRSLSDLGTQTIVLHDALLPQCDARYSPAQNATADNENVFVGTALHNFALPNRNVTPIAAFRIAIPAFAATRALVDNEMMRMNARCGRNITFADAVLCLGREENAIDCLSGVIIDNTSRDAYFGTKEILLPAAGIDFTISELIPPTLVAVTFHGRHVSQKVAMPERRSFAYPVGIDHMLPEMLPILGPELVESQQAVRASCDVAIDNLIELAFDDSLTFTDVAGGGHRRPLRLRVTWTYATILDHKGLPVTIVTKICVQLSSTAAAV